MNEQLNITMYVHKEPDGFYTLRQERFRGRHHKHDVCAVARSMDELRDMCERFWPEVDYSKVDNDASS